MSDRGSESYGVQYRPAADRDDVTASVQIRYVKDLQHPFQDVNVVLDFFATGDKLDVANASKAVGILIAEGLHIADQIGLFSVDFVVQPELHATSSIAGRHQDIGQNLSIFPEDISRKTQAVNLRHGKRDIKRVLLGIVDHAARAPAGNWGVLEYWNTGILE